MTLTLLVSASLLALVVTARPTLPHTQDLSVEVNDALQNIFESQAGHSAGLLFPGEKTIYVRITSPQEQMAYLAQLDDTAVTAVVPLITGETKDAHVLHDVPGSFSDVDSSMQLVNEHKAHAVLSLVSEGEAQLVSSNNDELPTQTATTSSSSSDAPLVSAPPLVVMIASCLAASVGFLGIGLALYIVNYMRSRVLTYQTAWEMLPRVERQIKDDDKGDGGWKEQGVELFDLKPQELKMQEPLLLNVNIAQAELLDIIGESNDAHKIDFITFEEELVVDAISSDDEFQDAFSNPPTPKFNFLPEIMLSGSEDDHPDPPLPSLNPEPTTSSIPRSPIRKLLEMRETNASPLTRPAWSLRADEDTSLFVPSPSTPSRSPSSITRTSLPPASDVPVLAVPAPRQRAYRSPVPEFDIALAMQLRPGLGLGADSAWMVRFLMAMFGWFTVLLTGRKERQQQRLNA